MKIWALFFRSLSASFVLVLCAIWWKEGQGHPFWKEWKVNDPEHGLSCPSNGDQGKKIIRRINKFVHSWLSLLLYLSSGAQICREEQTGDCGFHPFILTFGSRSVLTSYTSMGTYVIDFCHFGIIKCLNWQGSRHI